MQKDKPTTQTTTIQTRLPKNTPEAVVAALDAFAELFCESERIYVAARGRAENPKKSAFMLRHGLTARQFNALKRSAEGKIASQLGNLPNYIDQCAGKIARLEKQIAKTRRQIGRLQYHDDAWAREREDELFAVLKRKKERIDRLIAKKESFEQQLKAKRPSICFGSKDLFHQQYNPKENGYDDHGQWQKDWREARSSQFFVLGSKDETAGCQGCVISEQHDGTFTLRLRLPKALEGRFGTHITITGVRFSFQQQALQQAIFRNQERNEKQREYRRKVKNNEVACTESEYLARFGQALSYRFVRDKKRGWRVLITTELAPVEVVTRRDLGAVGVDLNRDHVSVVQIDGRGNKVARRDITFRRFDSTNAQCRTQICEAAKSIVAQALASGTPVVVEDLSFKEKKNALLGRARGKSAARNGMLSRLAYVRFKQALARQAFLQGVELIEVDPAYTSVIGALKYQNQTGFQTHQAAALVIARRGLGFRDALPHVCWTRFRAGVRSFLLPEDSRKDDPGALFLAKKRYGQWYAAQMKELRSKVQTAPSTDASSCRTVNHEQPKRVRAATIQTA